MRKNSKDYIPEIVKILNDNPPVHGYKISEEEVAKVLKYFLKNFSQCMQDIQTEVYLIPYIWISPVKSHVINYKSVLKSKRRKIFKKYFRKPTGTTVV